MTHFFDVTVRAFFDKVGELSMMVFHWVNDVEADKVTIFGTIMVAIFLLGLITSESKKLARLGNLAVNLGVIFASLLMLGPVMAFVAYQNPMSIWIAIPTLIAKSIFLMIYVVLLLSEVCFTIYALYKGEKRMFYFEILSTEPEWNR